MEDQKSMQDKLDTNELDYKRIASAIAFLKENYKIQPQLEEVAQHVHLSPFHFQRMFHNWAGVTPKQFLQYITLEHAKEMLKYTSASLSDTAFETGLSGTGRLHDLFLKIEGMTPGEYKNGGELLKISFDFADSPFGKVIIAATPKGICHLSFADQGEGAAQKSLEACFPRAHYEQQLGSLQQHALALFRRDWKNLGEIKLHLKGSEFQIKIWETLLTIPPGGLVTYTQLAQCAGHEGASRAAGTAIGKNPVAFLIPCHRVIKATGETGQYHWGALRKTAIIAWEAAQGDGLLS